MMVGFFLRRFVTVLLCAGSFWLGLKADRVIASGGDTAAGTDCVEVQGGN